jgi:Na+-transporting methylmalonyl-CoA/oxaloacetate decarboxylase gamma subunit
MNFLKNRLKERTSLDGAVLIACGVAMVIAPLNLIAYGMIAYGAWTLIKGEK